MSLATRCTACGTIFRVVQDQLKVSEGWVRCGRCDAVFSAMEALFDLDRDVPPAWPAPPLTTPAPALAPAPAPAPAPALSSEHAQAAVVRTDSPTPPTAVAQFDDHLLAPALAQATARFPQQVDSEFSPRGESAIEPLVTDTTLAVAAVEPAEESESFADFMASERAASAPDFVRHADKAQRWKHSGVRRALALTAVLLVALLGAQAAHHFRDTLSARWPQAKPAMVSACEWLRCSVGLPRRIDDVVVENTALAHTIPGSDAFKLSVSLRNRGSLPVALPSVDLSLTDASGLLVARRALAPRDFLASAVGLNAGADTTLSLMLNAGNKRVTGYTVEVFYP